MTRLGDGGCRALAASLKKGKGKKDEEDHALLAEHGQERMQEDYDEMSAVLQGGDKAGKKD